MHKTILFSFILALSMLAEAAPKYGPLATPLSAMSNLAYFQKNKAVDYWTLSPYYVPQETKRGCSAANLTMLLNAARKSGQLTSSDELITFKSLTEKYADDDYRDAIMGKTLTTGTNFSNRNLTRLLNGALEKLKIKAPKSGAELFVIDQKNPEQSRKQFFEALKQNEKSSDDFILFSFMQGAITGDPEGGAHVATVAAYDGKKNLVLVMDPDREWYEPYWTPADKLFDAIKDPKSDSRAEAGWIRLQVR